MKKRNVILRGVVPAAVALLIFVGLVLAAEPIEVSITPHHLSLTKGDVRFVRCNISSDYQVGNPYDCSLAIDGKSISAVKVESHIEEHDTTVVFFYVDDVRGMLAGEMGEVTLTLSIDTEGDGVVDFVGSDTIIVVD
jgi:hypothetical protein